MKATIRLQREGSPWLKWQYAVAVENAEGLITSLTYTDSVLVASQVALALVDAESITVEV